MMAAEAVIHPCLASFHLDPLPAGPPRGEGLSRMGLDRPELRARAGPALLAPARHRPRRHDDAVGRPPALGAVRGLGGRGGARRLPGRVGRCAARWRRSPRRRYTVRLEPVRAHGAWGGGNPLPGRARRPGPTARWRSSRARRSGRGALRAPSTAPSRRRPPSCCGAAGPARVGRRSASGRCAPGDVLALARRSTTRRAYAYRPPRAPRGRPPHARGALVLRGAVRALRALRRRGHLERARPAGHDMRRSRGHACGRRARRAAARRRGAVPPTSHSPRRRGRGCPAGAACRAGRAARAP